MKSRGKKLGRGRIVAPRSRPAFALALRRAAGTGGAGVHANRVQAVATGRRRKGKHPALDSE